MSVLNKGPKLWLVSAMECSEDSTESWPLYVFEVEQVARAYANLAEDVADGFRHAHVAGDSPYDTRHIGPTDIRTYIVEEVDMLFSLPELDEHGQAQ